MQKKNNLTIEKVLILIISFLAMFTVAYWFHVNRIIKFKDEPNCYTKSIEIKLSSSAEGQPKIDYKFKVNGVIYKSSQSDLRNYENKLPDTLTIKYLCDDPSMNELVFP